VRGSYFHGLSTEYAPCAWNYFVRHHTDDVQQARDEKKVSRDVREADPVLVLKDPELVALLLDCVKAALPFALLHSLLGDTGF
jgi:hypothetical protein